MAFIFFRGNHFLFGSVFIKKSNQTKIFFEKKPKPGQTDRFRFGFLGQKPVQTDLAQFFRFWLGFLDFGSVFPVLAWFSRFWLCFSGLVRFGLVFFRFFVDFGSIQFFRAKTGSNRFDSVFRFWLGFLGFYGLARFGLVFFWFFVGFGSFFWFFAYKTEPAGFFKNLISLIDFFSVWLFFFRFSQFNRFFNFFTHP